MLDKTKIQARINGNVNAVKNGTLEMSVGLERIMHEIELAFLEGKVEAFKEYSVKEKGA